MFTICKVLARVLTSALVFCSASIALAEDFPQGPMSAVTPGKLCNIPNEYRYPEHIPYCRRGVTTDQKRYVIKMYDAKFGYRIEQMNRQDFKIDHYIPLCAGGSNDPSNLWPQHKSIYVQTDPIEPLLCEKMAAGKLRQAVAVELIVRAKLNLSQVPAVMAYLNNL